MLFGLTVWSMPLAKSAIFIKLQLIRGRPLIFGRRVISPFTFRAG
jgi:hypothetical protein